MHLEFNYEIMNFLNRFSGPAESSNFDFCQQAGRERLDVRRGDLAASKPDLHKGPPLAHSGLLCPHRGGVGVSTIFM